MLVYSIVPPFELLKMIGSLFIYGLEIHRAYSTLMQTILSSGCSGFPFSRTISLVRAPKLC